MDIEPTRVIPRRRLLVLAMGAWTGWILTLLMSGFGVVYFSFSLPPLGIVNRCVAIGYAKQQDYFWFGTAVVLGCLVAIGFAALRKLLARRGWSGRWNLYPIMVSVGSLAISTGLAGSRNTSTMVASCVAAIMGVVALWFDKTIFMTDESQAKAEEWQPRSRKAAWAAAGVALLVSLVWIYDFCWPIIQVDSFHEGNHLLWVQSWLHGDTPGVNVRTYYGFLFTHSLIWWMKLFGMTVGGMRGYFLAVHIIGCAATMWMIWWSCRSRLMVAIGVWLFLTTSTATGSGYGWANLMRTALPMAAILSCWWGLTTGRRSLLAWSAVGITASVVYSQEFGGAAAVSCFLLFLLAGDAGTRRGRALAFLQWAGVGAGSFLALGFMVFGRQFGDAIAMMVGGNYATLHLMGVHVLPLPRFPWWNSVSGMIGAMGSRIFLESVAIWWPGLLCGLVAALLMSGWRHLTDSRRSLLAAVALFTLLSQLPVLARPMGQIGTSAPVAVWLLVLFVDSVVVRFWRPARVVVAVLTALAVGYGAYVCRPSWGIPGMRLKCMSWQDRSGKSSMPRLGSVRLHPRVEVETKELVDTIRRLCPSGERLYIAAPYYTHLAFLADRAGLPFYPSAAMAATLSERRKVVAMLEELKPPVALVTELGTDVPYTMEHPEEWAFIQEHYRLHRKVRDLMIFKRRP